MKGRGDCVILLRMDVCTVTEEKGGGKIIGTGKRDVADCPVS